MKRKIIVIASVAFVLVLIFGIYAMAQDSCTSEKAETNKNKQAPSSPVMGCCPGCPMGGVAGTAGAAASDSPQGMMQRCMSMMQQAGIAPAMMQRCQVMMHTPIFIDSPCAIYGQADVLKLSDEQKKNLIQIEKEARQKALAVLTDEQKRKIGDVPEKPMAMAQMCQQMCSKMMPMMQKMMSGEGKTGPMMMCPMMNSGKAPQNSDPKPTK